MIAYRSKFKQRGKKFASQMITLDSKIRSNKLEPLSFNPFSPPRKLHKAQNNLKDYTESLFLLEPN